MKRINIIIIVNLLICILLYFITPTSGKVVYVTGLNREKVTELLRESKVRIEEEAKIKKIKTSEGVGETFVYIYQDKGDTIESVIDEEKDKFTPYVKTHGISHNILYNISLITLIVFIVLAIKEKLQGKKESNKEILSNEDKEILKDIEKQ